MKRALSCFVALLMLVTVSASYAQITAAPAAMNLQGRLAKPDAAPAPDANCTLTFRIYDAQIGGNARCTKKSEL